MYISNSVFQNIRSQVGGAIYVLDSTLNKLSTDPLNKYAIYSTTFQNITAFAGGAVYFDSPHYSVVEGSFFNYCRALNVTYVT